ncbi:MAG: glucose-6-phosphate dehydrogenase assembly protein OpcA [Acidobacteriota bacterium]
MEFSGSVDVATIEGQLDQLWAGMTEKSDQDQQAVLRTCVLNLVVYGSDEASLGEISQAMARVSDDHPGRFIIILLKEQADHPIEARVTAQCHPSEKGRKQICCEQINITTGRDHVSRLASFVRPLLVHDLPVFLWWRDVPDLQGTLFAELVETSDRVIIDTCTLPNALKELRGLADWADDRARWTAFSDLSWCRLTPWRTLVAGFFDLPEYRSSLDRIGEVRIECTAGAKRQTVAVEALLLAGWLASRLKWVSVSKPQWVDEATCQWRMDGGDGQTPIEIRICSSPDEFCAGVNGVDLVVRGEPLLTFSAGPGPDRQHLESCVKVGRIKRSPRLIQVEQDDEAALLARELAILKHDRVYEQALGFLAAETLTPDL